MRRPMREKTFGVKMTTAEIEELHKVAYEKGYASASDYIRQLIRADIDKDSKSE